MIWHGMAVQTVQDHFLGISVKTLKIIWPQPSHPYPLDAKTLSASWGLIIASIYRNIWERDSVLTWPLILWNNNTLQDRCCYLPLKTNKEKLRELKILGQDHTVGKCWSLGLNLDLWGFKSHTKLPPQLILIVLHSLNTIRDRNSLPNMTPRGRILAIGLTFPFCIFSPVKTHKTDLLTLPPDRSPYSHIPPVSFL